MRPFGEALAELRALGMRRATGSGDGFADNFPVDALAFALKHGWSGRRFPGLIGWRSRRSPGHAAKCTFLRSGLDWPDNMHYSACALTNKSSRVVHGR
jgi:hypothetical protein